MKTLSTPHWIAQPAAAPPAAVTPAGLGEQGSTPLLLRPLPGRQAVLQLWRRSRQLPAATEPLHRTPSLWPTHSRAIFQAWMRVESRDILFAMSVAVHPIQQQKPELGGRQQLAPQHRRSSNSAVL